MEDKDLFILHNQYHGYWWPGDARSQVISNHGIHLGLSPLYSVHQINGLVQDCNNSSALAMELLQFCTKPSKCAWILQKHFYLEYVLADQTIRLNMMDKNSWNITILWSFCVWARPMREGIAFSHWLSPHTEWSLYMECWLTCEGSSSYNGWKKREKINRWEQENIEMSKLKILRIIVLSHFIDS